MNLLFNITLSLSKINKIKLTNLTKHLKNINQINSLSKNYNKKIKYLVEESLFFNPKILHSKIEKIMVTENYKKMYSNSKPEYKCFSIKKKTSPIQKMSLSIN